MNQFAQLTGIQYALQLYGVGGEAAVEADPGLELGIGQRLERSFGAVRVQGERLFAENVLTGPGGLDDLFVMLAVGRRDNYRVDIGPGQHLGIIDAEIETAFLGERSGFAWRPRGARRKLDMIALPLNRFYQKPPPAAEPQDTRIDHFAAFRSMLLLAIA
jgi:hypothetical protein